MTDYETYTVVYDCSLNNTFGTKRESVWILSRENTLPEETIADLKAKTNEIIPWYDFSK